MHKLRIKYALSIVVIIGAGLISRKIETLPLWLGDALWAVMIYLLIRLVFIQAAIMKITVLSLGFCYLIEISQLYQAPWINHIRSTLLGHLILGQGFLWSDLLAYTLGVLICAAVEQRFNSNGQSLQNQIS